LSHFQIYILMLNLNFDIFPELITERLVLRQLIQGDVKEIFMLRSDEDVNKFLDRPKAVSIDEARQFIHKINDVVTNSEGVYWAVSLKNEQALIGTICYWNIDEEKKSAEIGYELLPAFQGKGIMQEAIQKAISFGFNNMHLEMITAFPHNDNKNSIKLLEKNNFSRDEKIEKEMVHDLNMYVIYTLSKEKSLHLSKK
jgi:[ribosomal protein S5]-alanine N-acetyltransferase